METLGAALGLPAIRQKVMLLFDVFHSWCHSMVPFMDLGDKKIVDVHSCPKFSPLNSLESILTHFTNLPPLFADQPQALFTFLLFKPPPTWIISLHPTLCSFTEIVLGFRSVISLLGSWTNTKGCLWMEQSIALVDRSRHHFQSCYIFLPLPHFLFHLFLSIHSNFFF